MSPVSKKQNPSPCIYLGRTGLRNGLLNQETWIRMFRVALLTIVGLEATQVPINNRVDEWNVAVWSQDEILYSSQNE